MSYRPRHSRPSRAVIRRRRVAVSTAAIVILGLITAGIVVLVSSSGGKQPSRRHPHLTSTRCPLTDLRAPGGHVPRRPAVAVSVGNEADGARPQSGLDEADIVYDTPAEGFVMRYVAVFQCHSAASIGPDRSVRWVEWHLMQAFGHPILGFAGGISYDVDTVEHLSWLDPVDLLTAPQNAWTRISSRAPPDNLYTSTDGLLAQYPHNHSVPPAVFHYGGPLPPAARPTTSLAINFSAGTDVVWKWQSSSGDWLHTYAGSVDDDALTNQAVTTTNIVVEIVHYRFGPHPESLGSTGDVESQTVGSGQGYVLRDGRSIAVTWHRSSLSSGTTFTDKAGRPVTLAPGRTWVELVPNTVAAETGALTLS